MNRYPKNSDKKEESPHAGKNKDEPHSPKQSLVEFFRTSPLVSSGIVIERSRLKRK